MLKSGFYSLKRRLILQLHLADEGPVMVSLIEVACGSRPAGHASTDEPLEKIFQSNYESKWRHLKKKYDKIKRLFVAFENPAQQLSVERIWG